MTPAAESAERRPSDPAPVRVPPAGTVPEATAKSLPWWTALAVFLFSFAVRLHQVGTVAYWLDDDVINVPNAASYVRFGYLGPDNWWTPPLKHVLMQAGIAVFGYDPAGWRMRNVLFGAGVVLLTYLLARDTFRRPFPAIAAAVLLALDPLSIAFSRGTSEDVPAAFFILLACWLFVRAVRTERDRDWAFTGLALGISWALRWYALVPGAVMLVLAAVLRRGRGLAGLSRDLAYLAALPLAVYTASFLPWAARGYTVQEWLDLTTDGLTVYGSGFEQIYGALTSLAGPARWFTQWVGAGLEGYRSSSYSVLVNDPPIWCLFVPAVAFLAWRGYRGRRAAPLLVSGAFIAQYAFFLSVDRPILLYSSLPVVPFGFIALGYGAERLFKKRSWVFLAAATAWSLYVYPLVSSVPVPRTAYGWLLARLGVM